MRICRGKCFHNVASTVVASNNTGFPKVENNVSPINEMSFSSISQINEAMVKPINFGKGKLRYLACPISFNSANVSTSSKMVFLTQEDDISFTPSFFDQMKDNKKDKGSDTTTMIAVWVLERILLAV